MDTLVGRIFTKRGLGADLGDTVTYAKFDYYRIRGLYLAGIKVWSSSRSIQHCSHALLCNRMMVLFAAHHLKQPSSAISSQLCFVCLLRIYANSLIYSSNSTSLPYWNYSSQFIIQNKLFYRFSTAASSKLSNRPYSIPKICANVC